MQAVIDRRTSRRKTALTVLASLTVLAGCAGENLFSLTAGAGGVGPSVNMTAPAANLAIARGDSVLVRADVNSPAGATALQISSTYSASGSAAFNAFSNQALGSAASVAVSQWLRAATGQVAGSVYIVVQVTDLSGAVGKDSVKVSIN